MARPVEEQRLCSSLCFFLALVLEGLPQGDSEDFDRGRGAVNAPGTQNRRIYRDAAGFFSIFSNFSLEVLRVILFANSVIAAFGSAPCNTIFCRVAAQLVVDSSKYG